MNTLIFQLAVVFTPGLIWASMVDALCVVTGKRSNLRTSLRAFGFGLTSYLAYFFVLYAWRVWRGDSTGAAALLATTPTVAAFAQLRLGDILGASGLAVGLALVWSFAANRNFFHAVMRWLRITRKFGDESLWEFWFSRPTPQNEFVNFRDLASGLTFAGYVKAYASGAEVRELLLEQVRVVRSDTGETLYEMPLIYLSRRPDAPLHVEFPIAPEPAPPPASWTMRAFGWLRARHAGKQASPTLE